MHYNTGIAHVWAIPHWLQSWSRHRPIFNCDLRKL